MMNLTLNDLDCLKKNCDNLSNVIKELKKAYNPSNLERKLFVSRFDYEESLKQKNEVPQDFYYFRCFDVLIQIVYNKSTKMYSIYCEGFYSDILNKYKLNTRSNHSYIISDDFEKTFLVYKDLVEECLSSRILQNGLF